MTITQTVEIPENHRLTIDVPREVPAGRAEIVYFPAPVDDCPLCAPYRHPETGRLVPNAETIAAIEEGRAMRRGEIPGKLYTSFDEMLADLDTDD
ncbi:MAG: hypothetical protein FWG29_04410 [Treponema sp.]|nr:hypothetical protein [Treponema sp.]